MADDAVTVVVTLVDSQDVGVQLVGSAGDVVTIAVTLDDVVTVTT